MGTVKVDLAKSALRHDIAYEYTDKGVDRLLKDIHKLWYEESYRGDYDATCLRVDLEYALQSNVMTPKQRQAVALYYFCELTQDECARLLKMTQQGIDERLSGAVNNIAMHMQGRIMSLNQYIRYSDYTNYDEHFDMWMAQLLVGHGKWWTIDNGVLNTLNRVLGMPNRDDNVDEDSDDYPHLTNGQLRGRNRNREILREEIYPVDANVGSVKSGEDGKRIRLYRTH